jgi:HEAT repeats
MVRTYWNATLVAVLALPALAWGQQVSSTTPAATAPSESLISVKEAGKPEQRCRILKVWTTAEGATARQVQALDTGEIMTIVEIGPGTAGPMAVGAPQSSGIVTRIFHWGHSQTPPPGVPNMPMNGAVVSAPCAGGICGTCGPCQTGPSNSTMVAGPCSTCQPGVTADGRLTPCQSCQPSSTVAAGPCSSCTTCQPSVTADGRLTPNTTTVVAAPTSEHVPFWKRWFQHEPYQIPTQPPASMARYAVPPSQTGAAAQTSLAQTPAKTPNGSSTASTTPAKNPPDTPQPTDWRRSWGKADLSQAQAPAKPATTDASKTADASKTQTTDKSKTDKKTVAQDSAKQPPATKPDASQTAKPAVATNAPKPTSTPGKEAPGSVKGGTAMDLPRVDSKKPDPLSTPDRYNKQLDAKLKESTASADAKKATDKSADAKKATDKPATKKVEVVTTEGKDTKKKTDKAVAVDTSAAPGSSSTHPNLPLGAQSVLAAYDGKPGAVCYLPVPMVTLPASVPPGMTQPATPVEKAAATETSKSDTAPVNAFTAASDGASSDKMMANAFSSGAMEQPPMMGYPPAGMMMPPATAMMPGMPMRPGMPAPVAQAGYMAGPNGMVVPAYMPGMMPGQPGMTVAAAYPMPQSAAEMQNISQLLLTMRDSVYPSYREWAVEALATSGNNSRNPQVVDALVAAARNDPAATVRAACVRCLAKMRVNTAPAVMTIQGLKADPDPRVRSAVDQALTSLGIPQVADAPLQPASASAPAEKATPPAADTSPTEEHKEE